ncbi:integumentary mucin C.1-like [Papilio machaon]|uniref:integumentary mucin C.1-like n=1 Tax=Papilio machaon TaxID=76193 RepID=UPI001E664AF5|nr:integumentary mucin C.1-like [Papilio machaon]
MKIIIKVQIIIFICQSPTSQYKTPATRFHNSAIRNRHQFGISYNNKENKMKLYGDRKVKILDKVSDVSSNEFGYSEECLCSCNNCINPKECCEEMCVACPGPNDYRKLRPYNKPSGLNHLSIKQSGMIIPSIMPFGLNYPKLFPSWTKDPNLLRQNDLTSSTAAPYVRITTTSTETTPTTETTSETTTTTDTTTTTTTTTTRTTKKPTTSTKPPVTKPIERNVNFFIPGIEKNKYMFGIEEVFHHAHEHMNNYARILSTTNDRTRKGIRLTKDIFKSSDVYPISLFM